MCLPLQEANTSTRPLHSEASGRLPELLAEACNGRSAMLAWFRVDGGSDVLDYSNFSPQTMPHYAETFAEDDPWAKIAFSKRL